MDPLTDPLGELAQCLALPFAIAELFGALLGVSAGIMDRELFGASSVASRREARGW